MRDFKAIRSAWKYGCSVIGTLSIAVVVYSEFKRLGGSPLTQMNTCYIALLALVGALIFMWIFMSDWELTLLAKWVESNEYDDPAALKDMLLIVLQLFVTLILFVVTRNPLWFGGMFVVYSISTLLSVRYMNANHLPEAFSATREFHKSLCEKNEISADVLELKSKGLDIIDNYFIQRPHTPRHITILILAFIGLGLAVIWKVTGKELYAIASYIVFFIVIAVSEFVILWWRIKRSEELEKIKKSLKKLGVEM